MLVSPQIGDRNESADRLLLRNGFDLAQHFFHPATNLLPLLAQPNHFAAQTVQFFFAFFQLLAQTLSIAFRDRLSLARRLVHLNGAIDFVFQRLKIVSRNLRRYPISHSHRHGATTSYRENWELERSITQNPVNTIRCLKGYTGWSKVFVGLASRRLCREASCPRKSVVPIFAGAFCVAALRRYRGWLPGCKRRTAPAEPRLSRGYRNSIPAQLLLRSLSLDI